MKGTFDKSARSRSFQVGDIVLLWDKRREKAGKHGKFDSLWKGPFIIPFIIRDTAGTNSFLLNTIDGDTLNLLVNGQHLKPFYRNNLQDDQGVIPGLF